MKDPAARNGQPRSNIGYWITYKKTNPLNNLALARCINLPTNYIFNFKLANILHYFFTFHSKLVKCSA